MLCVIWFININNHINGQNCPTYKLSLISAESKLSALLIHSDTITMNNNNGNNNNMFQFTSS